MFGRNQNQTVVVIKILAYMLYLLEYILLHQRANLSKSVCWEKDRAYLVVVCDSMNIIAMAISGQAISVFGM